MPFTERKIDNAENPNVEFFTRPNGTIYARLMFTREKRDGSYEEFTVKFQDLDVNSAACIGRGARVAVYQAKKKYDERADAAYHRIVTPGSD